MSNMYGKMGASPVYESVDEAYYETVDDARQKLWRWLKPRLDRAAAEARLRQAGMVEGDFVVRYTERNGGRYVVSHVTFGRISHALVRIVQGGKFTMDYKRSFGSLGELVAFYQLNPLPKARKPLQSTDDNVYGPNPGAAKQTQPQPGGTAAAEGIYGSRTAPGAPGAPVYQNIGLQRMKPGEYVNTLDVRPAEDQYGPAPPRPPRKSDPPAAAPARPARSVVAASQPEYLEPGQPHEPVAARAAKAAPPPVSRAGKSAEVRNHSLGRGTTLEHEPPAPAPAATTPDPAKPFAVVKKGKVPPAKAAAAEEPFAIVSRKRPPATAAPLSAAAMAAQEEVLGFDPEDLEEEDDEAAITASAQPTYDLATQGHQAWAPSDSYDVGAGATWNPDDSYDVGAGDQLDMATAPAWMLTFTGFDAEGDADEEFVF